MKDILAKITGSSTALFSILLPVVLSILQQLLAKVGVTITNDLIVAATVGGGIGYGYKEGQSKVAVAMLASAPKT